MQWGLIINSVVCVLGTMAGFLFAGASAISIANMTVPWRGPLLVAAFLVPVMFVVSGIGAWITHARDSSQATTMLIALPWAYGVVFVIGMLLSFRA
jgi:hypothetical protein